MVTRSYPMVVRALTLALAALLPGPRPSLAKPTPPLAAGQVGKPGVATAPNPPRLRYRAVILRSPGYYHVMAGASHHGRWVGAGLPVGRHSSSHALLGGPVAGVIDLNPPGFLWSVAEGTDGKLQVGAGETPQGRGGALLWSGTAASAISLNPPGFKISQALSVRHHEEVGFAGESKGKLHAALWTGSAKSFLDLNPKGFVSSIAAATDGSRQVGFGMLLDKAVHALAWRGSAASAVDINPQSCKSSRAWGVARGAVVGSARAAGWPAHHAILWHGPANNFIDLNPSGFYKSTAFATNGTQEVGYGTTRSGGSAHALVWSGTPGSAVNLQSALPRRFNASKAFGITHRGVIVGIATNSHTGVVVPVEWLPISTHTPGPTTGHKRH